MSSSANLKRQLELTCAAMKEVVAEQVPKELEKQNFDLAQENAQLRQENARLRQLYDEAMDRVAHLDFYVVGHACHILRDARRNIRRIEQAPEVPEFTAALAEARDAMRRAETILEEVDELTESEDEEELLH